MGHLSAGKKPSRKKVSSRTLSIADRQHSVRRTDIHPLDRAIAELRAELARTPDDATILGRLGALFYRRGDLVEAEKHYRRAIDTSPRRPTLYNNLGNVLCDMGRMRDGIAAYEHAIAMEKAGDPERGPSQEAIVNLELAQVENRLVHERIEYLERAAQLEVSSAEAMNALGCGYLLRGKRNLALEIFRKSAEVDPRNRFAALNIAYVHTLNLDGDDMTTAQAEIAASILRFPNEPRLHIHQGELLENAGLLEDAEERYLRALEADTSCVEAYDLIGRLREAAGALNDDDISQRVDELLKRLEDGARENRKGGGALQEARALFNLAVVQVARARFSHQPLPQPAAVDALLREAVLAASGESSNAGGDARQSAREIAVRAAVLRAQLFEADGRRDEARVVLENAAQSSDSARLSFERGALALRCGDVDQAVANFDRATLAAPQDALAYQSLRFAFEGYRRYRSERVRFDTASKANPRDGLPHHHMALASLSVLKHEEALFHFTRALELDPRLSDAACGRGRALQRLGHLEEAEAAYAKALDIDPENAEAHRSLMGLRSRKLAVNG